MEAQLSPEPPVAVPQQCAEGAPSPTAERKPIHSLVLDAGPIIKNDPPVSTLLAQAEELYTIPSVISEIRDEQTRSRFETTLKPFLKLRSPRPESIKFVSDFARRTGDSEVLSKPDIHLLALTYELECERNGGDWRLRKTPAQKGVNGKPPGREDEAALPTPQPEEDEAPTTETAAKPDEPQGVADTVDDGAETEAEAPLEEKPTAEIESDGNAIEDRVQDLNLNSEDPPPGGDEGGTTNPPANEEENVDSADGDDDDSDGWITATNLKKHQEKEKGGAPTQPIQKLLQAAVLTSDFAMQNVALRINLNLVSPGFLRITQVKTWVLRCHGCFTVTRKMDRQFCPACGQATLTRTSCSTDQAGNFRIHLKRNYQFNKRGNVFSVPKPVHGSASGKNANVKGGGKNGWGAELILAEDQKEYTRKTEEEKRTKYRDLMDEDYLPSILTGERNSQRRIRVGAGRNVNSRKR